MKKLKIITSAVLFSFCLVAFSQSATTSDKTNLYLVQVAHTPDQCLNLLTDIKAKGDAFLAKFEFGCMSGDHTAYAFLSGKSDEDIRKMLPKDAQASAKIQKVDKLTGDQIEKIHKDHDMKK